MALFGDLEHHALADLAKVLHTQTGTLFFHASYQGRTLELALRQGRLRAMYLDGFPVREPSRVRDILRQLQAQARGAFEFHRQNLAAGAPNFYDLPLVDLLQEFGEAYLPEDQLPHPETRFVPSPAGARVPPSLADAWALVGPHLAPGASAVDLAPRVGLPQREVLVTLHRLRAVDLIAPQRAGAVPHRAVTVSGQGAGMASTAAHFAPAAPPPAPAPLLGRLLGALRRFTGAVSA
ncbi:hypothetical protein [Deinococcus aestuarii]|uniref:hypothetical protein n=1 Tax=Deinococcus aestuarii TaxID=2774531 RepID=UPI001C0C05D8|nr:hypothetical protein [Deinococcus aestuarii]